MLFLKMLTLSFVDIIPTVLICAGLVAIVALVIAYLIKNKKAGKSSCGCGCSGCAMRDKCHK